jgi:hypothetical protein
MRTTDFTDIPDFTDESTCRDGARSREFALQSPSAWVSARPHPQDAAQLRTSLSEDGDVLEFRPLQLLQTKYKTQRTAAFLPASSTSASMRSV